MVVSCSKCGAKYQLNPQQTARTQIKFRCAKCGEGNIAEVSGATATVRPAGPAATPVSPPQADKTLVNEYSGLALPKDKIITLSVIGGPSKGLKHEMTKPRVVVGRAGGGADLEINDLEISRRHCKVEVKQDEVRLRDLQSTNGTFVNDEKVPDALLEHLSEFRVGATLILVTIMRKED
jgi:hypothetical protein